jgi:hypothetical protein
MVAPSYIVDLKTRFIPPDIRVWRLTPGRNYRLLKYFVDGGCVFPELPALQLPVGPVTEDDPSLDARILAASAVAKWLPDALRHARQHPTEPSLPAPDADPKNYEKQRLPKNLHTEKSATLGLFGRALKGELVVVPHRVSDRRILVGEFLDAPEDRIELAIADIYGDYTVPARRVKWFPVIDEIKISESLSSTLRRPNPFTLLSRSYYRQIFDVSYGSYQYGDIYAARFSTNSQNFRPSHAFSLSFLTRLTEMLQDEALNKKEAPDLSRILSEIFSYQISGQDLVDLKININSPGTFSLRSKTLVPVIVAVLIAIIAHQSPGALAATPDVLVVNSLSQGAAADCTPEINENVRRLFSFMQYDLWKAVCDAGTNLIEGAQVSGESNALQAPHQSAVPPTPPGAIGGPKR